MKSDSTYLVTKTDTRRLRVICKCIVVEFVSNVTKGKVQMKSIPGLCHDVLGKNKAFIPYCRGFRLWCDDTSRRREFVMTHRLDDVSVYHIIMVKLSTVEPCPEETRGTPFEATSTSSQSHLTSQLQRLIQAKTLSSAQNWEAPAVN
eukprot:scaffold14094_cov214-Alexandrium_tamarense.AAC.2